jgi:hypothetical protein
VHSAPFKANSKGHATGNSVYVQNPGTQRQTRFDDHLNAHKITEAERTQMEAIDRLNTQNSDSTGNLGRKEPHSSQPDSLRNTLDSSNIHPNVFSSTARDRQWGIGAGYGSAIKTRKTNYEESARHQKKTGGKPPGGSGNDTENRTPEVGHIQVGREATQGAEPPLMGQLQVGRKAMLDNRIAKTSYLQVGRKAPEEPEALEHVIKTNLVRITCWPRS